MLGYGCGSERRFAAERNAPNRVTGYTGLRSAVKSLCHPMTGIAESISLGFDGRCHDQPSGCNSQSGKRQFNDRRLTHTQPRKAA
jgi:hypothetical protein